MNWSKIFGFRGLKIWLIASAIGWNLLVTFLLLSFSISALQNQTGMRQFLQIVLMIGVFLTTLVGGYACGRMAGDGRGPAYGVYGSLGSVILLLLVLVPGGGLLGMLIVLVAVFGGLNGGILSMKRR